MSDDDRDIDVESDDGDESDSRQSMGRGNAGNYYSQSKVKRKRREDRNDKERKRRDHLESAYQGLRDVLPGVAGRRLSRNRTLEETVDILARFKDAGEKHNFKFTVAEACSKIEEEKERILGLIRKAKTKNIDLDNVPGFNHFVETHNFNEDTMRYVKPRQMPKPRANPRKRLRRRNTNPK